MFLAACITSLCIDLQLGWDGRSERAYDTLTELDPGVCQLIATEFRRRSQIIGSCYQNDPELEKRREREPDLAACEAT